MILKMWILLLALCIAVECRTRVDPLVSVKGGLIKGLSSDGYAKFLGVPYGVVDEANPFGPSTPHPGFEETFEAYDGTTACPFITIYGEVTGVINCLTMNIYVPNSANSNNKLPVMVWIHGGAWVGGSAYGGQDPVTLLSNDVIIVEINYRLGIYGFMCLDIPEVPGNQGLKDQTLALRWINENIEAFGGDKNQITLFGESAGGMSVNLHLFSEYEKLYTRAIIQSGSALSYYMMVPSQPSIPLILASELNFNTTDVPEALSYLSTIDPRELVQVSSDLGLSTFFGEQPLTKPCVEKKFEGIEPFITEHPMNVKSNKVRNTPVIIGYNNEELALNFMNRDADFFNTYTLEELFSLGFNMDNDLSEAMTAVSQFYWGDEEISQNVVQGLIDFGTDFIFGHSTERMATKLIESGANVYRYIFSYKGSRNPMAPNGAGHGDELLYLFDMKTTIFGGVIVEDEEDQVVIDRFSKLWTNFAKFGNPTPEVTDLLPVKWEPITQTKTPVLDINSDLTIQGRPYHDRMTFWDIFYKHYGKNQMWYDEMKN